MQRSTKHLAYTVGFYAIMHLLPVHNSMWVDSLIISSALMGMYHGAWCLACTLQENM